MFSWKLIDVISIELNKQIINKLLSLEKNHCDSKRTLFIMCLHFLLFSSAVTCFNFNFQLHLMMSGQFFLGQSIAFFSSGERPLSILTTLISTIFATCSFHSIRQFSVHGLMLSSHLVLISYSVILSPIFLEFWWHLTLFPQCLSLLALFQHNDGIMLLLGLLSGISSQSIIFSPSTTLFFLFCLTP